jgi:PadR family transcriptional regulator, regulatory protein AphA
MDLSPTAKVILGLLSIGPKSGYEIKGLVDRSTRFFWAASYGQIYPELRKLADARLIEGRSRPSGGRKRTEYRLTTAGRKELRAWLEIEPEVYEFRDEGLLKLFFADAEPVAGATALEAKRAYHAEKLEQLKEIEPVAKAGPNRFPYLVVRYGIAHSQFAIDWCDEALAELRAEGGPQTRRRSA